MHLDNHKDILSIAQKSHFSIFVTGANTTDFTAKFNKAIHIQPNDKGAHDIETVRNIEALVRTKQTTPQIFVVEQADCLTSAAQNAFLKLLEEPNDNILFIFLASEPKNLLPTILSRAKVFYIASPPAEPIDPATLAQARTLVAGHPRDTIALATTLAKDRARAIKVTEVAISELYHSQTSHPTAIFIKRLEKLIFLEEALKNNGHIKLHVTNMIQ